MLSTLPVVSSISFFRGDHQSVIRPLKQSSWARPARVRQKDIELTEIAHGRILERLVSGVSHVMCHLQGHLWHNADLSFEHWSSYIDVGFNTFGCEMSSNVWCMMYESIPTRGATILVSPKILSEMSKIAKNPYHRLVLMTYFWSRRGATNKERS